MTIVNTKEFNFDMALEDDVIVQNGDNMFIVQNYVPNDEPDIVREPDDDFYRSITGEELKKRMRISVRNFFADKQ